MAVESFGSIHNLCIASFRHMPRQSSQKWQVKFQDAAVADNETTGRPTAVAAYGETMADAEERIAMQLATSESQSTAHEEALEHATADYAPGSGAGCASGSSSAWADQTGYDSGSYCPSMAGDTVGSSDGDEDETASARQRRLAPRIPVQENVQRGKSSIRNQEKEVGNIGIFVGNWGTRGSVGRRRDVRRRREYHDRQILKNPGHLVVLAEASAELEEMMRLPAVAGSPGATGVAGRPTYE